MEDRINISSLSDLFSKKYSISREEAGRFINSFSHIIEEQLLIDKYVKIKGWGIFKLIKIERGDEQQIEQFEISFIPDEELKSIINKPFAHFESVILNENVHFEDEGEEKDFTNKSNAEEVGENTDEQPIPEEKEAIVEQCNNDEPLDNSSDNEKENSDLSAEISDGEEEEAQIDVTPTEIVENNIEEINDNSSAAESKNKSIQTASNKRWYIATAILFLFLVACIAYLFIVPRYVNHNNQSHNQDVSVVSLKDTIKVIPPANVDTIISNLPKENDTIHNEIGIETEPKKEIAVKDTSAEDTLYFIDGTKCSYEVKNGESLAKIAYKFYGSRKLWVYIVEHNKKQLKNPDLVTPGTIIMIPNLVKKNAISD